jgi:hypothetical protein
MPERRSLHIRRRAAFVAGGVLVLAGLAGSCGATTAVTAVAQSSQGSDYLPLAVGNRWELALPAAPSPMVFEVTGRDGDSYVVRWDNPWIKATFRFRPTGDRVLMTGLDMGAGNAPMPAGTVYFDFGAREGGSWSNGLGRFTVVSRGERVNTPNGTYTDTIRIRATDQKGADTYWTFARGVGFVQFGEGGGAFRLASFRGGSRTTDDRRAETRPAPSPGGGRAPAGGSGQGTLIGIDYNPTPQEGFEEPSKRRAFKRAVDAGLTYFKAMPTWSALEPRPGEYNFEEIDFAAGLAEEYDLPLYVNVRVIDTGNKSVPSAYAKLPFDDDRTVKALTAALQAAGRRARGRVRWLAIGNEVDSYLKSRDREIEQYARMFERVKGPASDAFGGAQVTVNVTADAVREFSRKFGPITRLGDYASFTYYPLNINFTMRDPSQAMGHVNDIMDAAGSQRVMFQEIGYASAERLGSSLEKQAQFYRNVFAALEKHGDRVIGANFLFMSDLPPKTVEELGDYYKLPFFKDNFKAYLGTLGLFDQQGRPKPAWDVFREQAQRFKQRRGGGRR